MKAAGTLALSLAVVAGCAARSHGADPYAFGDPFPHVGAPPHAQVAVLTIEGPSLATKCAIPGDVVFFEFDSAALAAPAKAELTRLASCLRGTPNSNLAIDIVGRADPRGTDAYNYDLGMARADTVARYLLVRGVKAHHATVSSRGEEGTSPDEPWKFPSDRRVAVRLQDQAGEVASSR